MVLTWKDWLRTRFSSETAVQHCVLLFYFSPSLRQFERKKNVRNHRFQWVNACDAIIWLERAINWKRLTPLKWVSAKYCGKYWRSDSIVCILCTEVDRFLLVVVVVVFCCRCEFGHSSHFELQATCNRLNDRRLRMRYIYIYVFKKLACVAAVRCKFNSTIQCQHF